MDYTTFGKFLQYRCRMQQVEGYRELSFLVWHDLKDKDTSLMLLHRAHCLLDLIADDEAMIEILYLHKHLM